MHLLIGLVVLALVCVALGGALIVLPIVPGASPRRPEGWSSLPVSLALRFGVVIGGYFLVVVVLHRFGWTMSH
jgi:hypothetical protein